MRLAEAWSGRKKGAKVESVKFATSNLKGGRRVAPVRKTAHTHSR